MSTCHAEASVFLVGSLYVRGSMLLKLFSKHLIFFFSFPFKRNTALSSGLAS